MCHCVDRKKKAEEAENEDRYKSVKAYATPRFGLAIATVLLYLLSDNV